MATRTLTQFPAVDVNLKRTFENAVRDIYQAGLNGRTPSYRRPIVQRVAGPPASSEATQKKALSEAAKALAQLWKVSPSR